MVELGAAAFSADDAVHELYADPDVVGEVRARWGDAVLDADGRVDRSAIAQIVFADEVERRWLESVLHPLVARAWLRFVQAQEQAAQPPRCIVAEVPLLFEAGLEGRYDAVVTVTAPLDVRMARVLERGSGRELSRQRAGAQLAEDEKAARSDFVLVNDGDLDAVRAFAARVLESVDAHAPAADL